MCSQQDGSLRVFQHILQTFGRIFQVEWQIGRSCLVYGQYRHREIYRTFQHECHETVVSDSCLYQMVCQNVGPMFHLSIGQLAFVVGHGQCIRRSAGILGEYIGEGLRQVNL